jgi:DNA-binding NarL/FixJ family response regulator
MIVLQSSDSRDDLANWIEAGAVDYLPHNASPADLINSIREAARAAPRCSMSRHTRVIGPFGKTTYKAVYSNDNLAAAEPVVVRELETVLPQNAAGKYKSIARNNGRKAARDYDSSIVPIQ